jgi:hypothetical protein
MLDLNSINSREDFKWDLISRAFKDPEFSSSLKENPHSVLEQELGRDVARGITLAVHQESPKDIYFLINYNPDLPQKAGQIKVESDDNPEAVLVKKAWKDPEYRKELLADPHDKFLREFGSPMPSGRTLRVLEEGRDQLHLILPAAIHQQELGQDASALTDQDLEQVTGGGVWGWIKTKLGIDPYTHTGSSCSSASGVRG